MKVGKPIWQVIVPGVLFLVLAVVDQWIKFAVIDKGGFFIWQNILDIGYYQNYGIAFGIPIPYYLILALVFVALGVIVWRYREQLKRRQLWIWLASLAVLGGAFSNLFDRLYRGYVVDYIHFSFGSTFNLADVMIVGGVGVLLWRELRRE